MGLTGHLWVQEMKYEWQWNNWKIGRKYREIPVNLGDIVWNRLSVKKMKMDYCFKILRNDSLTSQERVCYVIYNQENNKFGCCTLLGGVKWY